MEETMSDSSFDFFVTLGPHQAIGMIAADCCVRLERLLSKKSSPDQENIELIFRVLELALVYEETL